MSEENCDFLTTQIITYLGNKRSLLENIENQLFPIHKKLNKEKLNCLDIFSGSGIVARMLKSHCKNLIVNDLENYSALINSCYLSNKSEFKKKSEQYNFIYDNIQNDLLLSKVEDGIISTTYSPKNDQDIQPNERVFYTHENAVLIDTYRKLIEKYCNMPNNTENLKKYFLAPLITEASIHTNTSGVFKGFYKDAETGLGCFGGRGKNALPRILGKVELKKPVFSNFECETTVLQNYAEEVAQRVKNLDIAYLDPPYNQHPYGSNYFMLNLIIKNKLDTPISKVSGITQDWNRSSFNKKQTALPTLEKIIESLDSKYVLISYNSEGFITLEEMNSSLKKYGKLETIEIPYNTFRGSRNLQNRNIHVSEYIFVIEKS